MVEFRPHKLQYTSTTGGHEDPENGDWIPGVTSWSKAVSCRYVPNGRAVEIELPNGDGTVKKYTYKVLLDLDYTKDYTFGEPIRLFDQRGVQVAEKTVLGFHRGQLNMKIWL
ncbi:MAG: hypothetical protein RR960_06525 [Alistipes sp.]